MDSRENNAELFIFQSMAGGDKQAFRYFFERYYEELCNLVNLYLHDPAVSEEIVQEIFIWFWEIKEQITINTSVKAYLLKSSRNKCLNYIRDQKRKFAIHEEIRKHADPVHEMSDEFLDAVQLREIINHSVGRLPDRMREIFLLRNEQNYSYREIAEKLKITEKTVENQMGLALKKLREYLRPVYNKIFTLLIMLFTH